MFVQIIDVFNKETIRNSWRVKIMWGKERIEKDTRNKDDDSW